MENRARYVLVGAFSLLVIAAGFLFVYWLDTAGSLMRRAYYRVVFDAPVSGLLRGSAVLFNGIRVGEVTDLALDPATPRAVQITIAIEPRTPVRSDTRVGIDFQGLTGAPVVALVGGSPSATPLERTGDAPALLTAEKNAGQTMGQAARDVLRHIDMVVLDNTDPLRNLISNIDKFSGALARNTDRVDGIIAGLERLTGGKGAKPLPRVYELRAATVFLPPPPRLPAGQLLVPEPTALAMFETERLLVRSADGSTPVLEDAQWPDVTPKLVQARLIQSFENVGHLKVVGRSPPDVLKTDHQLITDLRSFHIAIDEGAHAEIELGARIVNADGQIVDAQVFKQRVALKTLDAQQSAASLNEGFAKIASELVIWACAKT